MSPVARNRRLRTGAPYPTYTPILFEDGKPTLGVCIEVESGKDDTGQAWIKNSLERVVPCIELFKTNGRASGTTYQRL